jgi:hypothetical protein
VLSGWLTEQQIKHIYMKLISQIVGRERVEENKKNYIYILADYSLGTRVRKSIYSVKQILEPRSLSLLEVELNEKPTLDIHED